jgi:hypothetical protein
LRGLYDSGEHNADEHIRRYRNNPWDRQDAGALFWTGNPVRGIFRYGFFHGEKFGQVCTGTSSFTRHIHWREAIGFQPASQLAAC